MLARGCAFCLALGLAGCGEDPPPAELPAISEVGLDSATADAVSTTCSPPATTAWPHSCRTFSSGSSRAISKSRTITSSSASDSTRCG